MHVRRRAALAVSAGLVAATALLAGPVSSATADPSPVVSLPTIPDDATVLQLFVDGASVYADWRTGTAPEALYVTPADGTGTWQPVQDPGTGDQVGATSAVDGGTIVSYTSAFGAACTVARVATAGFAWTVPGCPHDVRVGAGGTLVSVAYPYVDSPNGYRYLVYEADLGPEADAVAAGWDRPVSTGTWVWTLSAGYLRGHDVAASVPDRTVAVPGGCDQPQLTSAAGDPDTGPAWALVTCPGHQGSAPAVVLSLTGTARPLALPDQYWSLGNGFVTREGPGTGGGGQLSVRDFSEAATQVGYGPMGISAGTDSGEPRVVYADADADGDHVFVADLDWLGRAPTTSDDDTAPSIDSTDGSPDVVPFGETLTFGWWASDDDSAPLMYDVQVNGSADPIHGWHALPGVPETFDPVAEYPDPNQGRYCFRVRALDRAGNTSPWSTPRCTSVDQYHPEITDGRDDSGRHVLPLGVVGPHRATYHFHGSDDVGVASYDVQERSAQTDRTLGAWRSPRADQRLTARTLSFRIGAGQERCFRARARDHLGRLSAYGDERCFTEPVDDRSLVSHGGVRAHAGWAIGDTVTTLGVHGQSLVAPHVVGHQLWVRVRSRSGVCPRVWWGHQQVMGACDEWGSWFIATVARVHRGLVRIEGGVPQEPISVDALAVVR